MTKRNAKQTEGLGTIGDQMTDEQRRVAELAAQELVEGPKPIGSAADYNKDAANAQNDQDNANRVEPPDATAPQSEHEPSRSETLLANIRQQYSPRFSSIADASAELQQTAGAIGTLGNEIEGTNIARMTTACASILFLCLTAKPKPVLFVTKELNMSLMQHIKKAELMGKPTEEKDTANVAEFFNPLTNETKSDGRVNIDKVSPYKGKIASYLKDACTRACLMVLPHTSNVCEGFIHKDKSSGRRFTRNMVFVPREQLEGDENNYFRAVCVPANVVRPHVYISSEVDGKSVLSPYQPSTNESLLYLTADWAEALYQHFFAGEDLQFDVTQKGSERPTGFLVKPTAERVTAGTQNQRATTMPKTLEEAQKEITKLRDAVTKASQSVLGGNLQSPTLCSTLETLAKQISDQKNGEITPRLIISTARILEETLKRGLLRWTDKMVPANVGRSLVRIKSMLDVNIQDVNEGEKYNWLSDAGNVLGEIPVDVQAEQTEIEKAVAA